MAPRLWMTGSRVVLENTHFRAELTTSPGIALTSFVNKALGNSSLLSEAGAVFAVLVEDAPESWEYSDAFVVTNRGRESAGLGRRLQMEFVSTQLHLSGQFSIYLSAASEMLWRLELRNDGAAARRLCVAFPLLPAVRLSDDPSQDYYFFPMVGGWCVNLPYDLAVPYGMSTGSLQLLSVFCSTRGGGAYIYVRDDTGGVKVMMLRKRERAGQSVSSYIPLFEAALRREPAYTPLPLPETVGTSLGVRTLWLTLGPGERLALPEAAVGVHVGDFRPPLERYCAWVRTWWQPPRTPTWPRGYASYCYAHDEDSVARGRYVARPDINPPHQVMQWAYWWRHSDLNRLGQDPQPDRWYRDTHADYEYEDRWGGAPPHSPGGTPMATKHQSHAGHPVARQMHRPIGLASLGNSSRQAGAETPHISRLARSNDKGRFVAVPA